MSEFDILSAKYNMMLKEIETNKVSITKFQEEILLTNNAKQFLISFSEFSKEQIKDKLETLANTALRAIFIDKQILFKIMPDRQKRGIYYDLMVDTDGDLTPLFDAKGGGVLDVVSIALRISYLKLFQHQLRQMMVLDEPFKNLDAERLPLALEWLKTVSSELEIQFIIVSHIPELQDLADKSYRFKITNGVTTVEEQSVSNS